MKGYCTKVVLVLALAFAVTLFFGMPAFAGTSHAGAGHTFHTAAGLICQQCHTMHNMEDSVSITGGVPNAKLLRATGSNICLRCHSASGTDAAGVIGTNAPKVYSTTDLANGQPGGNFRWVGSASGNRGNGHNIIATAELGGDTISADLVNVNPPGSTTLNGLSSELQCYVCHNPHGSGLHRYVREGSYTTAGARTVTFLAAADLNTAESTFTGAAGTRTVNEISGDRNAYQGPISSGTQGFGRWCGSCHGVAVAAKGNEAGGGFHTPGTGTLSEDPWYKHPTAKILPTNGAGGPTGTSNYATNYSAVPGYSVLVPFEDSNAGNTTTANWAANNTTSQVFCLSCHRAHATTNLNSGRWSFAAASGANARCNKCHAQGV